MMKQLHDYLNVLNFMYLVGGEEMRVGSEVAYSDIKGEVISSYPQQVSIKLAMIQASQNAAMMEELMDFNEDEEDYGAF